MADSFCQVPVQYRFREVRHIQTESGTSASDFSEKRRSPRMRVTIPLLLVWADGGRDHFEPTYTLSISWFGCKLHSKKFFRLGQAVQLSRGDGKAIGAEVIYCLGNHADNSAEVGLGFEEDGRAFWEMPVWKDQ